MSIYALVAIFSPADTTASKKFVKIPEVISNPKNNLCRENLKTNMEKEKNTAINHVDYKDITRLRSFTNPHARILSRKRTELKASAQRDLARAIKRARFMALLPYVSH